MYQGDVRRAKHQPEGISILLRVLYLIVPHITYALWQDLGYASLVRRFTRYDMAEHGRDPALTLDDRERNMVRLSIGNRLRDHLQTTGHRPGNAALRNWHSRWRTSSMDAPTGLTVQMCSISSEKVGLTLAVS